MQQQLNSEVAVITGGSRGIGRAVATDFVKRGIKVVIGDIRDTEGEAVVKELNERYYYVVALLSFNYTITSRYEGPRHYRLRKKRERARKKRYH